MIDKIMLGLQEGSVNKTTGIRVVSLMIRTLFKEFGLTSPIAAQFAKNFSNKIPKHLFIAAGLIIGTIDLYCCQTCCILAWYKLPYSEEYNMKDMITAGLEDLF